MHKYLGFIGNRLRRLFRKPDIDYVCDGLYIGGRTSGITADRIYGVEHFKEGEYIENIKLFDNAIKRVAGWIGNNETVFVHCRVGRGRAPLFAMCYLMKYYKLHPLEAIIFVQSKRPFIYLNDKQMKFLRDYYKMIRNEE